VKGRSSSPSHLYSRRYKCAPGEYRAKSPRTGNALLRTLHAVVFLPRRVDAKSERERERRQTPRLSHPNSAPEKLPGTRHEPICLSGRDTWGYRREVRDARLSLSPFLPRPSPRRATLSCFRSNTFRWEALFVGRAAANVTRARAREISRAGNGFRS
jgi:hypothetical protein